MSICVKVSMAGRERRGSKRSLVHWCGWWGQKKRKHQVREAVCRSSRVNLLGSLISSLTLSFLILYLLRSILNPRQASTASSNSNQPQAQRRRQVRRRAGAAFQRPLFLQGRSVEMCRVVAQVCVRYSQAPQRGMFVAASAGNLNSGVEIEMKGEGMPLPKESLKCLLYGILVGPLFDDQDVERCLSLTPHCSGS